MASGSGYSYHSYCTVTIMDNGKVPDGVMVDWNRHVYASPGCGVGSNI